jgi:Rps23 Pro-64 3,4-dihydroxylase Tpa1-like proline 4-hydroxylase
MKLYRRLNLIVYLNKNWTTEYGGELEMWDKDMRVCVKKIEPLFNRAVIFSTTRFAYHGHPNPVNCPPNMTRKSVALYYYTRENTVDGEPAHDVLWQERPQDKPLAHE